MCTRAFIFSLVLAVSLVTGFASSSYANEPKSLVFLFQKQKDPLALKGEAEAMAKALSKQIGMPVTAQVPGDYAASVQALVSGTADVAYVDSMSYLLAERDAGARILLAETRTDANGVLGTSYDSLFVVPKGSKIMSLENLKQHAAEITFAFTSATSTSGYVIPAGRMIREQIIDGSKPVDQAFKRVVYAGSYGAALEQVAAGLADIAAVSSYAFEGAAADKYLPADKRAKLEVLARTPGVPTHVIIARGGVNAELAGKITNGLLAILAAQPKLLSDVYGAAGLKLVDAATHVQVTRDAVSALKIELGNKS